MDLAAGTSESWTTTQGRLLMLLWQGDEGWLDADREEPPLPRSARDLAQALREGRFELPVHREGRAGCRFVLVVDLSSDASRVKGTAVADALRSLGPVEIHDRMPVMLPPSAWDTWLDPDQQDTDVLGKLLVPAPASIIEFHPVSTEVNNARNKGAHLLDPVENP